MGITINQHTRGFIMHRFIQSLTAFFLLALAGAAIAEMDQATRNFRAHLSGADAGATTRAQGQALFQLSADGQTLHYRLNIANLQNLTMAHIHLAPVGQDGPVVVWLYPSAPPPQLIPERFSGVLSAGAITAANLVGPLAGQTLDDLLAALENGNAYVNVHTNAYPAGEIRGQIR